MIVDTPDLLAEMLRTMEKSPVIVLDTEDNGLDPFGLTDRRSKKGDQAIIEEERCFGPARICGLAIGVPLGLELKTFYLPVRHETAEPQLPPAALAEPLTLIERRHNKIVGHHLKYDLKMLWADGIMPDDRKVSIADTMIHEHVLHEMSARDEDGSGDFVLPYDEGEGGFGLANMAVRYNGHDVAWKEWVRHEFKARKYRRYSQFRVEELGPYSEDDVFMTWINHQFLDPKLDDPSPPWYGLDGGKPNTPLLRSVYDMDMKLLWALVRTEINGMKIDRAECARQIELLHGEEAVLKGRLDNIVGRELNFNSVKQLREFFVERGWTIPRAPDTGAPQFSDIHLAKAAEHDRNPIMKEFVDQLYNWKRASKFRRSYFEAYLRLADEDGLMHPEFWEHGTITGRLSCHKPNFQNIPNRFGVTRSAMKRQVTEITAQSEIKRVIVPRDEDHMLLGCDYSQQEMRMFLNYADEPAMKAVLLKGGDIHELAAEALYGEPMPPDKKSVEYGRRRLQAKVINFGILYGMGPKKLGESMEISLEEARVFYANYMDTFSKVKEFTRRVNNVADARLWINMAFGRRRRFRMLTDEELATGTVRGNLGRIRLWEGKRAFGTHKALNHLIQGSCAEITRRAMVRVDELLRGTRSYLINSVHDELVYDLHRDEAEALLPEIVRCMTDWPQFEVPFTVDPKPSKWSWAECEKAGS